MQPRGPRYLVGVILVLLVAIGALQSVIDPVQLKMREAEKSKSEGGPGELMVELPGQFIVASVAGFKEVIAGALWIRADTFFHRGNYGAIVPIVRLVTWLDPHNIDVYTTGAWHLDYNFVDEANSLSDKRYIPASIALLREGIRNNPDIWDLHFELGWTHYNKKMMDYEKSLECLEKACALPGLDPNTGRKIPRPDFVDHMLAHAYEKVGRFDDAIAQWKKCRARVEKLLKKKNREIFLDQTSLAVVDRNLAMLYLRLGWRYGDMDAYGKGIEIAKRLVPVFEKWAVDGAAADYARRLAENDPPKDALRPLDMGFEVAWKKVAPKVILIKGKLNLVPSSEYKDLASEPFTDYYKKNVLDADADRKQQWRDGCRVYWRLQDYDYVTPDLDTFDWRIDTTKTVQGGGTYDGAYVSGGQFSHKIDMSDPRDAGMYPFKAKKYKLTIWFSPQHMTPIDVQDRIGWKGEAIRDENYLDTTTYPGFRTLRTEFIISREELL